MQRKTAMASFFAVVLALMPFAAADWGGRGFYEPDTSYDKGSGWMFESPDTDPNQNVQKVYFSAYVGYFVASANHNVATLGSQIATYPTSIHAFLGVWKDCNNDGYIGLQDGALFEYSSLLLVEDDICPAAPGGSLVHNDGNFVREMLIIGPDFRDDDEEASAENDTNPWNIPDEGAYIWGDWGLPDAKTEPTCPVNPRPRGTYQSTGGFLRYTDCFTNWRVTGAANDLGALTGVGAIRFDDAAQARPDQSGSVLNQQNPYGKPRDQPLVSAYDCAQPAEGVKDDTGLLPQRVDDPRNASNALFETDAEGNYVTFYMPRAPVVNGGGSLAGTTNETAEGAADDCDRDSGAGPAVDIYGRLEEDFEGTTAQRTLTDVYFNFFEGWPANKVCDGGDNTAWLEIDSDPLIGADPTCVDNPYDPRMPDDAGQGFIKPLVSAGQWFGAPGYVASRNPYVDRGSLQPWGAVYFTTYAYVTPRAGLELPSVTAPEYGAQHCGSVPTGAFECDASKWWLDPEGKSTKTSFQVTVGQPYNLRDIDCYDATAFRGSPFNTGMLAGNDGCSRPAS